MKKSASNTPESVDPAVDLVRTVKTYAIQETVQPIRGAARWVALGLLAAVSLGLAMVFFAMAVLRLSQDLGGRTMAGTWSFVHYLITLVVVLACVGIAVSRINKPSLERGA